MNLSATPSTKPPLSLNGNVVNSRPVRPNPNGKNGGAIGDQPLPPVTDPKPTPPADAPTNAPPTDAPDDIFSLEGLLAEWGQRDSVYDLDENGDVNGWDLALFLGGHRPKGAEQPEFNLQGLLDSWGQTDSPYDLDGNGTVDGMDLAHFLGGQQPGDNSAPAESPNNSSSNTLNPADGVANTPDNSSSNTVGDEAVADTGAPDSIGNVPTVADETGEVASAPTDQAAPTKPAFERPFIERFARMVFRNSIGDAQQISINDIKASDTDKAQLDPDGDGLVNRADLKAFIQKSVEGDMADADNFRPRLAAREWIDRLGGAPANEDLVSHPGEPVNKSESKREAMLARLTDFLGKKLDKAGFEKHPPRNLHAVIARLDLEGTDRSFLMKQLAAKYPRGLGINRVG